MHISDSVLFGTDLAVLISLSPLPKAGIREGNMHYVISTYPHPRSSDTAVLSPAPRVPS